MNPGASPASPTVIEPADLAARLPDDELLIVDVGAAETYRKAHLPGAVHLDYARLILGRPPQTNASSPTTTPATAAQVGCCGLWKRSATTNSRC